jgi:hypothetical protein
MTRRFVVGDAPVRDIGLPDGDNRDHPSNRHLSALLFSRECGVFDVTDGADFNEIANRPPHRENDGGRPWRVSRRR